jgi:ribonuclease D
MNKEQIVYINTASELAKHIPAIEKAPRVAVDLEFDRNRYKYGFTMCLMQIMAGDICYLIDPLNEELDLSPIYKILEDPKKPVVVFSFQEDLMLFHLQGCRPTALYDTGVAIRLLDVAQSSLAVVLKEFLDIEVNKDAQKSNWFNRPLSQEQLNYAAQDVFHLFSLMDVVDAKAKELERAAWIKEENAYWESMDYSNLTQDAYLKEKDKKDFTEVQWHVFSKLMDLREEVAKEKNQPSGRILRTDYVKDIILKNGLRYWEKNRSSHPSVRDKNSKVRFEEVMIATHKEAIELGLSETKTAKDRWSKEEYQQFKEAKRAKEELMTSLVAPIHNAISERAGENTSTYIMSNRMAMDLMEGVCTSIPKYRVELIKEVADSLSLDPSPLIKSLD